MIILEQNTGNTIALTLTESVTLTGSTGFTLTLENDMSKYSVSGITLTDLSAYPDRYNKFILTTTSTRLSQNLTGSTVYLSDTGFYTYNAYVTNSETTELVETGKMLLQQITPIIAKNTYTGNQKKVVSVYQNKN